MKPSGRFAIKNWQGFWQWEKQRESIIQQCFEEERESGRRAGRGLGDLEVLAVDVNNLDRHIIAGRGSHGWPAESIRWQIAKKEDINPLSSNLDLRIWRGIIHQMPGFQSRIIKMLVYPERCVTDQQRSELSRKVRDVWQFFREKYPDWIMIDGHGNPFEEYLRQDS